ncbi:MAG: plasmid mobilization relaxosome protein MobC [Woeseiaceae bacterium]
MVSNKRKQNKVISVRLDEDAHSLIREIAASSCISISGYAKACMLGQDALRLKHQKAKPTPDLILLSQILSQIGKIGSNINQIAKKLNKGGLRPNQAEFIKAKEDMMYIKEILENALNL